LTEKIQKISVSPFFTPKGSVNKIKTHKIVIHIIKTTAAIPTKQMHSHCGGMADVFSVFPTMSLPDADAV